MSLGRKIFIVFIIILVGSMFISSTENYKTIQGIIFAVTVTGIGTYLWVSKKKKMGRKERLKSKGSFSKKVLEIECICKKCKKVWHYTESEKRDLENQVKSNKQVSGFLALGLSPLTMFSVNKMKDIKRKLNKFEKCPKCRSGNITKKRTSYTKK